MRFGCRVYVAYSHAGNQFFNFSHSNALDSFETVYRMRGSEESAKSLGGWVNWKEFLEIRRPGIEGFLASSKYGTKVGENDLGKQSYVQTHTSSDGESLMMTV